MRSAAAKEGRVAGSSSHRLPELWYDGGNRKKRLPEWGTALIELGAATVTARLHGQRLVIVVVVPIRAYAATLAAVGAVAAHRPLSFNPAAPSDAQLEQHFQRLRGLRPGTTVTVGQAKLVGSFVGVDESGIEPLVVIRQAKFIQKLPRRGCHLIGIAGRSLGALLVGRMNAFEAEITGGDVCNPQGQPIQELLKVSRYCRRADKDVRAAVLASGGDLPSDLAAAQPGVVIFDGTAAFRHWREAWRSAPWLVVLDRCGANFDDGVALVEDEYVRRIAVDDPPDLPVPSGTEVMAFWTAQ